MGSAGAILPPLPHLCSAPASPAVSAAARDVCPPCAVDKRCLRLRRLREPHWWVAGSPLARLLALPARVVELAGTSQEQEGKTQEDIVQVA